MCIHIKTIQGYDKKGGMEKPKTRNIQPNGGLIESIWVFKKKGYGQFMSRLIARGYIQIPGVDFSYYYSPVVSGITLQVILIIWLFNKWNSHNIDIETYFIWNHREINIHEDTISNNRII